MERQKVKETEREIERHCLTLSKWILFIKASFLSKAKVKENSKKD